MSLFKTAPKPMTLCDRVENYIAEHGDDDDILQFAEFIKLVEWSGEPLFNQFDSIESFMSWAAKDMGPWMSQRRIELAKNAGVRSIAVSQGMPSSSDLEDAQSWAECTTFVGSERQCAWARSIALKNLNAIALAFRKGAKPTNSAKWWIDNQNNIVVSLPNV